MLHVLLHNRKRIGQDDGVGVGSGVGVGAGVSGVGTGGAVTVMRRVLTLVACTLLESVKVKTPLWSSNSTYALLGGLRSAAQMISYEIPMGLAFVTVFLYAGSVSTSQIVTAQEKTWYVLLLLPSFLIYVTAMVGETNRAPFDLPEAEGELVGGFHTEYSSMKFALFFLAEYVNMVNVAAIATTLFLGGWQAPLPFLEFVPSYLWFGLKLGTLLLGFMWIRATFPRLRIDQLTRFAWKFLVPLALINLVTAAFWSLSSGWSGPAQLARWAIAVALVVVPFQLIGRRLRELSIYCEIVPFSTPLDRLKAKQPRGIILQRIRLKLAHTKRIIG